MPKNDDSEFLHYDEHSLDAEWQRQAPLFHRYAVKLADAKNRYAEAKAEFELQEAELSRAVRATPERYGLQKTTEALIEATVKVQQEYQSALRAMNKARHDVDVVQAAVDALHHKKAALENAVSLWAKNYFATPTLRDDGTNRQAREKAEQMVNSRPFDRVRKRLNE